MIKLACITSVLLIFSGVSQASETSTIAEFVRPLVGNLENGPGDVWSGSGQGGYIFRFFFDVNEDGTDELFLMSSTFPNAWKIYMKGVEGNYNALDGENYLPIPATGFEYRSDAGSHEIVLASLDGAEIVQTQYQFNGNAINIETERVDASKWEPRTESLVVPQIEKVFLPEYLNDPSTPWQPVDLTSKETLVTGSGYYSFPNDREMVERWKQFSPRAAIELLNKIERPENERPATSDHSPQQPLPTFTPRATPQQSPSTPIAAESQVPSSSFAIVPVAILATVIVAVVVFLVRRKSH